jgi:hypothetical protein
MLKINKKHLLLLTIFTFAFIYRIFLLTWQTYPPGSDIGFQAGVINSITHSGNVNFLWNSFQMGGEIELQFPGYHIFVSEIIIMTGLTNYLAQAIVVAFFSSLILLAVFLLTRLVWNEPTAFIVAFFVAISRADIEMLCWGGEPNIVALFLIPTIFYVFLKKDKIAHAPFLVLTSFLVASMLLVHSLSGAVFLCTIAATIFIVLAFPKTFNDHNKDRKSILWWVLPILTGGALISPFLASAVPPYLNQSVGITGTSSIKQALIVNRSVSLETFSLLFVCIVLFFLLSKKVKGRFFSLPLFLVMMWLFVPLVLTQDYLFGLYFDSVRFLYFLIYPVLILLAILADYLSKHFAKVLSERYGSNLQNNKKNKLQFLNKLKLIFRGKTRYKVVYGCFLLIIILLLSSNSSIFSYPWNGVSTQKFYQVMDNPGFQAIEWIKKSTPSDSVFVSDMSYGWWLAGIGERQTLTDIPLQDITLAREIDISKNVSYLLDTDYMIDNGYIQVREDGGYIGRHNPVFLADSNRINSPYAFFQFNSSEITLLSHEGNNIQCFNIAQLAVANMQLDSKNSDSPSIKINKENSYINYSEITTVTKGNLFANLTITVQAVRPDISLDQLNFTVNSPGIVEQSFNNTIAIVDPSMKLCGQLIFYKSEPVINNSTLETFSTTQISYNLQGKSKVEIQILVGINPISDNEIQNPSILKEKLTNNLQKPLTAPALPILTFDYKLALKQYNVLYVVNRNFDVNSKYLNDPQFSIAFNNIEVAIFKVEENTTTIKG